MIFCLNLTDKIQFYYFLGPVSQSISQSSTVDLACQQMQYGLIFDTMIVKLLPLVTKFLVPIPSVSPTIFQTNSHWSDSENTHLSVY